MHYRMRRIDIQTIVLLLNQRGKPFRREMNTWEIWFLLSLVDGNGGFLFVLDPSAPEYDPVSLDFIAHAVHHNLGREELSQ